ncbi:MAG: flagellar basal body-associated FliL family protein [Gemmatimonadaceae bacterium]
MSDHAAAPAPAEGEVPPAGVKAKLPLIAALVVGLAVGAGSGAVVVGPMIAKTLGFTAHATPPAAPAEGGEAAPAGEHGEAAPAAEHNPKGSEAAAPPVLLLENLVLNPASSGGSRYLLMSIAIESADAKAVAALTLRDAELKDLILTSLSKKTVDELSDVSGREHIKSELTGAIRERFGKAAVKQLYFPQFVIQ